jgi:hypothetical protein
MDQGLLTDWLYTVQVAATAASITAQVGTCHFIPLVVILTQALVALSVHVGFCVRTLFGWIALFCCVECYQTYVECWTELVLRAWLAFVLSWLCLMVTLDCCSLIDSHSESS